MENKEFIALMELGRPGIQIPGRHVVGGRLLDSVYAEEWEKFKLSVAGVTISILTNSSTPLIRREEAHNGN